MPESESGGAVTGTRPVDPDIDLRVPQQRFELLRAPWSILGVIAVGGAAGALARYGLGQAFPHRPGAFAWSTFTVNAVGCALIGVLMVMITEVWRAHPLVRPLLGVGVLGGFTTFSTYIVDAQSALQAGAPRVALAYLVGTPVTALVAVAAGVIVTRMLDRFRRAHLQRGERGDEESAHDERAHDERVHEEGLKGRS